MKLIQRPDMRPCNNEYYIVSTNDECFLFCLFIEIKGYSLHCVHRSIMFIKLEMKVPCFAGAAVRLELSYSKIK